jgi:hypothetical protein
VLEKIHTITNLILRDMKKIVYVLIILLQVFYINNYQKAISQGSENNNPLNVVSNYTMVQVYFNISLCNNGNPENTIINMVGDTNTNNTYQLFTDTAGTAFIDTVVCGIYDIRIDHFGYELFTIDSILIINDTAIHVDLMQKRYSPCNMGVDSMTNTVVWDKPLITALPLETFEDTIFPPWGWQSSSGCPAGWLRTNQSLPSFTIPQGDGYFAVSEAYSYNGTCDPDYDYLITPLIDLRESDIFFLNFDYYNTYNMYQSAYVEYSCDFGNTWEVLSTMSYSNEWREKNIVLSNFAGPYPSSILFNFHAKDDYQYGSGWAVDNISITAESTDVLGYNIHLDNNFIENVDTSQFSYTFYSLTVGQIYTVCIDAVYECGVSELRCDTWEFQLVSSFYDLSEDIINIFPNPAKDYITITSTAPINNIRINNYVGQEMYNSIFNGVTSQNIVTSNYQTGVYIIEITTKAKVITKKVIITN